MLLLTILAADEKPNFTTICVINEPVLRVVMDCKHTFKDTENLAVIANVSLELNKTGWMFFDAQANVQMTPKQQMKAIGYAEGYLFQTHLWNHQQNIKEWFLFAYLSKYKEYPPELYAFYQKNMDWTRKQSQINHDSYWRQVAYTMAHFDGLVLGYQQQANASSYMSELEIFMYVSSGDLLDVVNFAMPHMRPILNTPEMHELRDHCSGMVKIDGDDIYLSQTAWFTYGSMTRVSKIYRFDIEAHAKMVKFSSYPGFSYSFDDWYATDSGFMYFETTNNINDPRIYDLCDEESLQAWVRAPIAGRMAVDSEHFSSLITKYNSGTYNNQWVVVDLKKFESGATENIMWVMEQIPGKIASQDATERLLRDKYFPSYNIPSMLEVRQISGYPAEDLKNPGGAYDKCPRKRIFEDLHVSVKSIDGMRNLMRYNDFEHDKYGPDGKGNLEPGNAISSRYDRRSGGLLSARKCFGGFDNKIGQYNKATKEYTSHFISSPTYQNVTAWTFPSTTELFCPRHGLPDGPYKHEWIMEHMERAWQ